MKRFTFAKVILTFSVACVVTSAYPLASPFPFFVSLGNSSQTGNRHEPFHVVIADLPTTTEQPELNATSSYETQSQTYSVESTLPSKSVTQVKELNVTPASTVEKENKDDVVTVIINPVLLQDKVEVPAATSGIVPIAQGLVLFSTFFNLFII